MKKKKLYLLRHAKSSWDDFSISDFDRPLNKRGLHDAPMMANRLKKAGVELDIIISSPAKRAKSTAIYISDSLDAKLIYDDNIYEATTSQLKDIVVDAFSEYNTIMIVGHNPSLTMLSNSLSIRQIENIPTCGIVGFDLDDESLGRGALLLFDYPKNESL